MSLHPTVPAAPVEAAPEVSPSPVSERAPVLDALRGVALFGILLINITTFKAPGGPAVLKFDGGFLDQAVVWALVGVALREGQPFVVVVAASLLALMFLLSLVPRTGSLVRKNLLLNPPVIRWVVYPTKGKAS